MFRICRTTVDTSATLEDTNEYGCLVMVFYRRNGKTGLLDDIVKCNLKIPVLKYSFLHNYRLPPPLPRSPRSSPRPSPTPNWLPWLPSRCRLMGTTPPTLWLRLLCAVTSLPVLSKRNSLLSMPCPTSTWVVLPVSPLEVSLPSVPWPLTFLTVVLASLSTAPTSVSPWTDL